jgi:hypothetical protein
MKKTTLTIALALVGTVSGSASAQQFDPANGNLLLRGSDTLEFIMQDLVNRCSAAVEPLRVGARYDGVAESDGSLELDYVGGGSGEGENSVERDSCERATGASDFRHQLGAMSRTFDGAACTPPSPNPQPGAGCPVVTPTQVHVGNDDILNLGGSCDAATACPGGLECVNNLCIDPDAIACTTDNDCNSDAKNLVQTDPTRWECVAGECMPPGGTCNLTSLTSAGDGSPDDWAAPLRTLYFGIDDATYNPAVVPIPANAADTAANCGSTARRAIVDSCGLYHIYRRDDASGTTADFKRLLNVPANQEFCNSTGAYTNSAASLNDKSDEDPIRIPCNNDEDVCRCDGTLGFMLPILVPPQTEAFPISVLYPQKKCEIAGFNFGLKDSSGADALSPAALGGFCSDGSQKLVGGCVYGRALADGDSACMYHNKDRSKPTLAVLLSQGALGSTSCPDGDLSDVRSFNLDVRTNDAAAPTTNSVVLDNTGTNIDWHGRAFYRIHSWSQYMPAQGWDFDLEASVMPPTVDQLTANVNGVCDNAADPDCQALQAECQALDATVQIGCLVGRDARWGKRSLGFAGLQAGLVAPPTNPVPGNRLTGDGVEAQAPGYPFARKLYINTLRAHNLIVDNLYTSPVTGNGGDEKDLLNCVMNEDALLADIVADNGFGALPGGAVTPTTPACGD